MKRTPRFSDKQALFLYFLVLIFLGTGLLLLPAAYKPGSLTLVDALFTTVSAVCVTGLSSVDTGDFSLFGQIVILGLIQSGGLGFITFSTLYLVFPGSRFSFSSRTIIQEYYGSEHIQKPGNIVQRILFFTFFTEIAGMALIYGGMRSQGVDQPLYSAVFHGISAFCNAGFSLYPDSLARFSGNQAVMAGVGGLIICGGMGFMVLWNLAKKIRHPRRVFIRYHTKIMLFFTPILLGGGFLGFFLLERNRIFGNMGFTEAAGAAFFQSITTRTAGFSTVDQSAFTLPSYILNLILMLIGGGSGSTAGGLKVSTMFLLVLVLFKGIDDRGEIPFLGRRISKELLHKASLYFMKAVMFLVSSVFLVSLFESFHWNGSIGYQEIFFECVSALGTVGLSMGITADLSPLSQMVIICTMFAGRIGLFAIIIPSAHMESEYHIRYPEGEVLIG